MSVTPTGALLGRSRAASDQAHGYYGFAPCAEFSDSSTRACFRVGLRLPSPKHRFSNRLAPARFLRYAVLAIAAVRPARKSRLPGESSGLAGATDEVLMTNLPIITSDHALGDQAGGSHACGLCTACCVWLAIPAGQVSAEEKPVGAPCPHVRSGCGCNIYSERPATCSDFSCAWLANEHWPPSWRPYESGLLCLRETLDGKFPAAVVYEIRADALLEPRAAEILDELLRTTAVVAVVNFQQRRVHLSGRWCRDPAQPQLPRPHFASLAATRAPVPSHPAVARVHPT